jgi:hypothetical protein
MSYRFPDISHTTSFLEMFAKPLSSRPHEAAQPSPPSCSHDFAATLPFITQFLLFLNISPEHHKAFSIDIVAAHIITILVTYITV